MLLSSIILKAMRMLVSCLKFLSPQTPGLVLLNDLLDVVIMSAVGEQACIEVEYEKPGSLYYHWRLST